MDNKVPENLNHYIREKYFEGKNVLVSGATGGIGSVVVEYLVKCGARVIGMIRNEEKMKKVFQKQSSN